MINSTKLVTIIVIGLSLALTGCSTQISNPKTTPNEQKISYYEQINQLIQNNNILVEIVDPILELPTDIPVSQLKQIFKLDNILFALVLQHSMNFEGLQPEFDTPFAGILIAQQGDNHWEKLLEIKDKEPTDKNNPYYLFINNKRLFLTVVDQNGAGSGEGIMKLFTLDNKDSWTLTGCYYFGDKYNGPEENGDYFEYSTKLNELTPLPKEKCNNVTLINLL